MDRRLLVLMIVGLVAVGFGVNGVPLASAGAVKSDVCHLNDEGGFQLISVSENAVAAHERHGDGVPGTTVPGMDGYVFGEDCELVADQSILPGCYDSAGDYSDLELVGPVGQADNTTGYVSFDGSCTGSPFEKPVTIVLAADLFAAGTACDELGLGLAFEVPLNSPEIGYSGLPDDAWLCV